MKLTLGYVLYVILISLINLFDSLRRCNVRRVLPATVAVFHCLHPNIIRTPFFNIEDKLRIATITAGNGAQVVQQRLAGQRKVVCVNLFDSLRRCNVRRVLPTSIAVLHRSYPSIIWTPFFNIQDKLGIARITTGNGAQVVQQRLAEQRKVVCVVLFPFFVTNRVFGDKIH